MIIILPRAVYEQKPMTVMEHDCCDDAENRMKISGALQRQQKCYAAKTVSIINLNTSRGTDVLRIYMLLTQ